MVRYLRSTSDQGIIFKPDKGEWTPDQQATDPPACMSRTGYVIFYVNCPIIWASKLQMTIALLTTEAEYVALLTSVQDVIYFMNLIDEMKTFGIHLPQVPKPWTFQVSFVICTDSLVGSM